jgi:hypoxanthine phosphoribosyltransferase
MSAKRFVSGDELMRDSFRLARRVLDSGWHPDLLVTLWRGGAPIGIAAHEFLCRKGLRPRHLFVRCSSYVGIGRAGSLRVELSAEDLAAVRPGNRVLLVDDIFDTGRTAAHMRAVLAARGAEVRVATIFWKPSRGSAGERPDYHLHETAEWVVFPHELEGLTPEEIRLKDPVVADLLAL